MKKRYGFKQERAMRYSTPKQTLTREKRLEGA